MNAQSILIKNIESYQAQYTKSIIDQGTKYTLKRRFMLGEGMDFKKMLHAKMMYRLLCTENCELKDYIWDKINGKLKDKCSIDKPLKHLIEKYKQECNQPDSSDCDIITQCVGKFEW